MNSKKYIRLGIVMGVAVAIVLLLIAGALNYPESSSIPTFSPESMEDMPLRVIVIPTEATDRKTVLLYDGKGTSELKSENDSNSVRLIETRKSSYTCDNDDCSRLEGVTANPLFNPNDFMYNEDDIDQLRQRLSFIEADSCSTRDGTCTVWMSTSEDQQTRIEVHTATNRIVTFDGTSPAGGVKLLYEYPEQVRIVIPPL